MVSVTITVLCILCVMAIFDFGSLTQTGGFKARAVYSSITAAGLVLLAVYLGSFAMPSPLTFLEHWTLPLTRWLS